jgi:hypothetical protein
MFDWLFETMLVAIGYMLMVVVVIMVLGAAAALFA